MKKLLLSIFCSTLAVLGLQAEEKTATLSFADASYRTAYSTTEQVWENDGIKFINSKGTSTSNVADYSNPVRLYKNSSITVEYTSVMTKIEFTCNSTSYAEALVSAYSGATQSDAVVTVEPNSDSFTIEALSGGQVRLNSLTVYYDESGSSSTLADPEISWSESSVSAVLGEEFTAPTLTNANNLAVTYSSSDEAVATVDATGTVTIVGAGTTTIKATWEATETYKSGSASYTLNVLNAVATLTEFINEAPTTNTVITGAVTVYYQSSDKRYTFITDGTSNLQVYGTLNNAYSNGDQLTGIIGKMGAYSGMSQMVPDVTSFGTATAGTPVEPKAATLAEEIAPCDYVILTGINLSDISDKSCTLSDGTNTLTGYNRFGLTLAETENATITGIGAVYNETKQLYIISVEGGSTGGEDPIDPNAKGGENNPYTVAEAIALGNPGTTGQWVSGIIVGVMNWNESESTNVFSATELTTNSNIVIADTDADFGTNFVAVQLPSGKIREDLNLVDRPGNLGKEVSVCGDLIKYCGVTGVKNTSAYTIVGGLAPLPIAETESLTSFVEEQFSSNTKIIGTVTVFYQSPDKKYTFITDGTTNLEVFLYAGLANSYVNGDQLSGIVGKFEYYHNMPQFAPQADSFGEATPGTAIQPVETTLSNVNPADFVMIKNATITSEVAGEKTVVTVSDASGSRILFDRFNIGVTDATNVNILGIGAVYDEDAQLFPIEITPATDGIDEITTESNGKAAIYDLQGRKLNAPVRGINIINGRKVLVK